MKQPADTKALAVGPLVAGFQAEDPAGETLGSAVIDSVLVRDGLVQVALGVDRARAGALEPARRAAEGAIARLPGVRDATIVLTAHRASAPQPAAPQPAAPQP